MTSPPPSTRPAVRSQPPPALLMRRVVNPVARLVTRSPAARWTGDLALLEFTTGRTGRLLRIPVLIHHVGSQLLVFTDAGWAANFRSPRRVTLLHRGRRQHGWARLSADPAETATALRAALLRCRSPRRLGLSIDPGHQPTNADLSGLRQMIAIAI